MADEQITKVLEIRLNYEKTIKGIAEYEGKLREVRQEQGNLKDALKDGTISQQEYDQQMAATRAQIKQLKTEQATLTKQLQQNIKAENAEADSLVQLRAKLSNLTAEYDAMSGEMRNGEAGKALQDQINAVTDELKGAEEDTQRYYRNVGNYANSVREAFATMNKDLEETRKQYEEVCKSEGAASEAAQELKAKMEAQEAVMDSTGQYILKLQTSIIPFGDKLIPLLGKGMKGVKEAFVLAGEGAKILSKQLLALMANPIVAFLALLAAAIAVVVKGIASSEENMNKWNLIMAPLKRGLAALQSVIQTLCGWILNVVAVGEGLISFFLKLAENLPVVGDAFKSVNDEIEASIKLEQEKIAIEKQERANTVQNAKDALEVAKLRAEANDKESKTAEERLAANQKAQKLLEEQADREVNLAERKLKALQEEAKWADNDAETNRKLAEAEAAVYQARERQYQQTLRLQRQENSLREEIERDAKAEADAKKQAAEKAVQTAKDRAKKEQDAIRQAEDAMLALVKDSAEKRRKEIEITYDREIEDLKAKLATEENLTKAARDAISQTIQAKEKQRADELAALDAEISDEAIARKQEEISLMLDAVKEGTEQEYQLKLQQLALNEEADLAAAAREITNAEELERRKQLIRDKYAAEEEALEEERNQKQIEQNNKREQEILAAQKLAMQNRFTELLMQAEDNSVEQARINMEQKQQELELLHQMEGESNDAFIARQLEAQKAFNDAKKKLVEQENKVTESKLQATETVVKGISGLLDTLSDDNKAFAKAAKVLALAEIAINTGKAIAAGVAQAQSVPYPGNLVAIATTVATVLANVASAISTVKSAKFAKGGKVDADELYHANGGKISGAGTGTSDSIPAMLSNGEFVMNAAATRMFEPMLAQMNDIGRGVTPQLATPYTMSSASPDVLTESFAASVADIHPVVSVVDINEGQKRVDVIDSLDTI